VKFPCPAAISAPAEIPAITRTGKIPGVPIYITLMKWTSQGLGGIPAWRDRVEEAERAIEQRGGKLVDAYVTLGRYDVIEIFEAPNDETAYQVLIEIAKHGQVTTETLRAFTRQEAEAIVRDS
jgi:uncharacterized protein with GYD domain